MNTREIPRFPGVLRKNDSLFLYGALQAKPFVYTYEPSKTEIVHGPSCRKRDEEIFLNHCRVDAVAIMERRGGGGTVLLAPGMVVTVVVGEREKSIPATFYFDRIHNAIITLFEETGISGIEKCGISDLALGGRKILGSSLYMGVHPELFYYQSSLLVDPDLSLFDQYLRHPPREPEYRRNRSHREFCTSLAEEGYVYGINEIRTILDAELAGLLLERMV